ncbi:MAG TPA: zinc ribbon domain-containing protein [Bryobacteraceae bacterium]|jgi:putative FmdB family regulatory protein
MPIFEYSCDDCGSQFEQLVRRTADADQVRCPSCGQAHLTTQYSTFAARAGRVQTESVSAGCGSGMCGADFCGSGACGMNPN